MDKIENNSFEAINLFVIYICFQDGKVSEEEAGEIALDSSILKHFYFECYGEVCDLDLEKVSAQMQNFLTAKFKSFTNWEPEYHFEKTMEDLLNYWRDLVSRHGNQFLQR